MRDSFDSAPVPLSAPGQGGRGGLAWGFGGGPPVGTLRVGAIVLLVLVLVTAYGGRFTRTGRSVYALGGSEEAALLMGLPVPRTRVLVYAFIGLCSALAGIVFSLQLSSSGQMDGVGMELDAIAAVVIGGALLSGGSGGVLGSFVGTLIIGLILTIVTYEGGLGAGMIRVLIGGLLLAFVLLQKLLSRLAGAENPHGEPL